MKTTICKAFAVISVVMTLLLAGGCQKWSHNGDLDGQWQVMEVTYSGTPVDFPDGDRFYYDFYLHTFQLGFTDVRPTWLRGNMTYEEAKKKLILDFPYIKNGKLGKEWRDRLIYWGVPDSGEMDLDIKQLTSSRLVMQYGDVVITCRKF